eukprot:GFUD01020966.1.p1 GENE.GFUD01020966.1~~GFUD01020966.1.p1  ORF type:complete len:398 (+),score=94.29 GFUD01020966.1:59-1252(+)
MEDNGNCDLKSETNGINESNYNTNQNNLEPSHSKPRTSHDNATKLIIPQNPDIPDAKPSADASEVDAKPIPWPSGSSPSDSISVPTSKDSKSYTLEGTKKVVIFNQKIFAPRLKLSPRKGTDIDVKSIQNTFKSLDWDIDLYNDCTVSQIREVILKQIQLSEENIAALAIFILSHGEDNGTIFASDYPFRVDHDILFQLAADKSPNLAGKPKLVFVQACQGQETDAGSSVTERERRRRHTSQDSTSTYKIPNYADFLIFQASFWDHYSFRSSETGSWFIQSLCSSIDKSSQDEPLFDILLSVSHSVAITKESNVPGRNHLDKKKQVPLLYSTMLRRMYLKGPKSSAESVDATPELEKTVTEAVSAIKLESKEMSGSQKSLFRRDKTRDTKDKDCSVM